MRLNVKVRPNSLNQELIQLSNNEYKVFLKKSAQDNKANEELVKYLTRHFKKKVRIIAGLGSRNKLIEVVDG